MGWAYPVPHWSLESGRTDEAAHEGLPAGVSATSGQVLPKPTARQPRPREALKHHGIWPETKAGAQGTRGCIPWLQMGEPRPGNGFDFSVDGQQSLAGLGREPGPLLSCHGVSPQRLAGAGHKKPRSALLSEFPIFPRIQVRTECVCRPGFLSVSWLNSFPLLH